MNGIRHREVGEYLRRLQRSMANLPAERRQEILAEIEEHIAEDLAERPAATDADVRNALERVGDPADIAYRFRLQSSRNGVRASPRARPRLGAASRQVGRESQTSVDVSGPDRVRAASCAAAHGHHPPHSILSSRERFDTLPG
jgi:hypothetical protein